MILQFKSKEMYDYEDSDKEDVNEDMKEMYDYESDEDSDEQKTIDDYEKILLKKK